MRKFRVSFTTSINTGLNLVSLLDGFKQDFDPYIGLAQLPIGDITVEEIKSEEISINTSDNLSLDDSL